MFQFTIAHTNTEYNTNKNFKKIVWIKYVEYKLI